MPSFLPPRRFKNLLMCMFLHFSALWVLIICHATFLKQFRDLCVEFLALWVLVLSLFECPVRVLRIRSLNFRFRGFGDVGMGLRYHCFMICVLIIHFVRPGDSEWVVLQYSGWFCCK